MTGTGVKGRLLGAAGAFVSTWRNRELRRVQLGFGAAWTAEWAFTVALGVYAFRHGGATAVGVVSLLRMLPSAVVTPIAAPYADRWRREHVLAAVSGVRGAATAMAAAFVSTGGPTVAVFGLAVVSTVAAVLYRPVHSALLPSLCRTPYELAGANVVRGMLDSVAALVGPALAAVLLETSGVTAVFAAAAGASAWSAALTLGVRPHVVPRTPSRVRGRLGAGVAGGLDAVRASRELRLLVGLTAAQTLTRGMLTVFTVVVAIDLLGTGEAGVGTLTGAVGAGAVSGSFGASLLVGTRRLARWFGAGVALWGLPLCVLGAYPSEALALALLACIGVGNALVDVGLFTLMARLASDVVLARVFGALESVVALAVGAGALLTPLAIELIGLRAALVALGLLSPVLAAASWRRLRRLDECMVVRDREIALLRPVPMLSPLSLPAVEQLARALQPVDVPAGATVFAQGDIGDRFYVIDHGVADVVGDGRAVATLGPGEAFGEIALLRRVPRTATVRARTDLRLESLTAERFLPVVTGFRSSADQATAQVDALLNRFAPQPGPPAAPPSRDR